MRALLFAHVCRPADCDGATVFEYACALGCEGIVSKRVGSPYRSGRVDHWLKIKNLAAPAVKREAEGAGEDNGRVVEQAECFRTSNCGDDFTDRMDGSF